MLAVSEIDQFASLLAKRRAVLREVFRKSVLRHERQHRLQGRVEIGGAAKNTDFNLLIMLPGHCFSKQASAINTNEKLAVNVPDL